MIDLLKDIDGDGDIIILNDDLRLGTSDKQHMNDLIITEKGSIKQFPAAGVGAQTYLEAEDRTGFIRELSNQFFADGMVVKKLEYNDQGLLNVGARYK